MTQCFKSLICFIFFMQYINSFDFEVKYDLKMFPYDSPIYNKLVLVFYFCYLA